MKLKTHQPGYRCPYCTKPVGYLGRVIAALFGTRVHNCDGSNVISWEDEPDVPPTKVDVNVSGSSGKGELQQMVNRGVAEGIAKFQEALSDRVRTSPDNATRPAGLERKFQEIDRRLLALERGVPPTGRS